MAENWYAVQVEPTNQKDPWYLVKAETPEAAIKETVEKYLDNDAKVVTKRDYNYSTNRYESTYGLSFSVSQVLKFPVDGGKELPVTPPVDAATKAKRAEAAKKAAVTRKATAARRATTRR